MNLTEHFTLSELTQSQTASRLGMDNFPPPGVMEALKRTAQGLEQVRALVGAPILVSSGYRSPYVNRKVGGAATSQHTKGEAADITTPACTPDVLMARIRASVIAYDQLILEFFNKATGTGWVHISFSDKPRKQALVIDSTGTRTYA